MDWVDRLCLNNYSSLLTGQEPPYWTHGLMYHLGFPSWPFNSEEEDVRTRFFVYLMDCFCPPADLEGLYYQLSPLSFITESSLSGTDKEHAQDLLQVFSEMVIDYIDHKATNAEREVLKSRELHNISEIGLWRFHFHCAQINRNRLDQAIISKGSSRILVNISKLAYLKFGKLDPIYKALAPRIHRSLRKRLHRKIASLKEAIDYNERLKIIYNESLASEHTLHIAHHFIDEQISDDLDELNYCLVHKMRYFFTLHRVDKDKKYVREPREVRPFIHYIASTYYFISDIGAYRKFYRRRKRRAYNLTRESTKRLGRLLPKAIFEQADEAQELSHETEIESPLIISQGVPDDLFVQSVLKRRYGITPKIANEVGETESDYEGTTHFEIPASWLVDPYQNAIKQQVQIESSILSAAPPIWSSQCLMISTLQNYLSNAKQRPVAVHLFALLSLYTGLTPDQIARIRLFSPSIMQSQSLDVLSENEYESLLNMRLNSPIYLDVDQGEYSYLLDKEYSAYYSDQSPAFIRGCEESSLVARIRLPGFIISRFKFWVENEPNRFLHDPDTTKFSHPRLFTDWKSIQMQWGELLAETGRMSAENLTPSRIRATFLSLFIGQMEFPELYAHLVMREIPIQYRAQHFYANINLRRLNKLFAKAAESIHGLLTAKGQGKDIEGGEQEVFSYARTGSRLIPRTDVLKRYFAELHASFALQFEARIVDATAWNRLMLFIYRLFQLATGIRPMRDSVPTWQVVSLKMGWMRISDKDNLHFYESRFLPLAAKLKSWLGYLESIQPKSFIFLNLSLSDLSPADGKRPCRELLTFAEEKKGMMRPFKLKDVVAIEEEMSLAHPFTFKANALRHHLLTRLLEAGVDQLIIDFIIGHKHYGKEPFGRFSLMHPLHISMKAKAAIDDFVIYPLEIPDPPAP